MTTLPVAGVDAAREGHEHLAVGLGPHDLTADDLRLKPQIGLVPDLEVPDSQAGIALGNELAEDAEGFEHADVAGAYHGGAGVLGPVLPVPGVVGPRGRVAPGEDDLDALGVQRLHHGVEFAQVGLVPPRVARLPGALGLQLVPVDEDARPLGAGGAHLGDVLRDGSEIDAAVVLEAVVDDTPADRGARGRGGPGQCDEQEQECEDERAGRHDRSASENVRRRHATLPGHDSRLLLRLVA